MLLKSPTSADDPYPHAAYLAVTAYGEVIGVALGHPGSTLVLHITPELAIPGQFTLQPHNVPAGRQAPALVCHTPQGLPAVARQKRAGYFAVTCYAERPDRLCFDAVYEAWIWKRLQAMAASPSNASRLACCAELSGPGGEAPSARSSGHYEALMPMLPFPLPAFTPHRPRSSRARRPRS
ncbi:Hypothetical protein Deide_1p01072 (plasmid) [Deinococcus deserti VCD115]|uniref:Uncharacterized protein n=1 Tax=Deinococcus deserti (strain DSM 17065 / CIP 109153 / LMG 22923 / VCD115) TaxID=546414 RepID=C1D292_DEIDV|nr:Hypothetical protein Deide_1p01072 [Deinococcus deserti VCD115]